MSEDEKVMRRSECTKKGAAGGWKIVHNERVNNLFLSTNIIGVIQITHSEGYLIFNMRGEKMRNILAGKVYGEETNISN